MKLYGTIRSERASKGQGGNEYLHISLQDERVEFASLHVTETPEGISIAYDVDEDIAFFEREPRTKGEKARTA